MKNKNKLATCWVLTTGKDCDGFNSGHVTAYQSYEEAYQNAQDAIEWSDGLGYHVTDKLEDLESYCDDYDKNINHYKTI
jgi:hypothetical protein